MNLDISQKLIESNSKLFKSTAYDIRAYVGEVDAFFQDDAVLTPEAMHLTGALMGLVRFKTLTGVEYFLSEGDTVVVGYDNGPTSEILATSFSEGLNLAGINVYNIGIASSGQVYQNQEQLSAQGHCQITRSHVEVTTNGAKFGILTQGIHTYFLAQMYKAVEEGILLPNRKKGISIDKREEARKIYFDKMLSIYKSYFSKRDNSGVAINLFGGTGIQYADLFREILGANISILGVDIDVNSGKILADPTRKEMLERVPGMQQALDDGKRVHSFDLDADRGSLTEGKDALSPTGEGHYLGDSLAFILAEYKIKIVVPKLEKKLIELNINQANILKILDIAKTIYVDARYTSSVKDYVDTVLKGKTLFHRKGHSLWKETITANMLKMSELAGFRSISEFVIATGYRDLQIEASLHLFSTDTQDGLPRDDGVENIFILEEIIDALKIVKLKDFFDKMPKRFITKEIRTNSTSNELKDSITYEIIAILKSKFSNISSCNIVEFDGQIRIDWDTGFIMYGMSNTSPKLTFMAEGSTIDERNEALAYLMSLHNSVKAKYNDTLPMDVEENPFYMYDKSYNMSNPDTIDMSDKRAIKFISRFC